MDAVHGLNLERSSQMGFDKWWHDQHYPLPEYVKGIAQKAWDAAAKPAQGYHDEQEYHDDRKYKYVLVIGGKPGAAWDYMMMRTSAPSYIGSGKKMVYHDTKNRVEYRVIDGYAINQEDKLKGFRPDEIVLLHAMAIDRRLMHELEHIVFVSGHVRLTVVGYTEELGYEIE